MITQEKRIEYYSKIANCLDELIPCEWQKIVMYAREDGEKSFFTFYYQAEDGEVHRWTDIAGKIYNEKYAKEFAAVLNELTQANKEYWQECMESDEDTWYAFSFELDSEWKFKVRFDYDKEDTLPEVELEAGWVYETLGEIQAYDYWHMALRRYLEAKGQELPKKMLEEMAEYGTNISIVDTPEKYEKVADELIPFLTDFLRAANKLEEEIFIKDRKLDENKYKLGIPAHIIGPGQKEIFGEFRTRFAEMAKDKCMEELLKKGARGSFGSPSEYAYIDEKCEIVFMMKSAKKAVIETRFRHGTDMKHQFVFKLTDEGWRISGKKYGFRDETTWYKSDI